MALHPDDKEHVRILRFEAPPDEEKLAEWENYEENEEDALKFEAKYSSRLQDNL